MSNKKNKLSKNKLWWKIAILRYAMSIQLLLIVLVIFIVIQQFLSIEEVKTIIEMILEKIDKESGLRFFIFTTAAGLALFGFKKLISEKIDTYIHYIQLKDFPKLNKSDLVFESLSDKKNYGINFLKTNVKHKIPIRLVRLLFLTSIPVLIAYYSWNKRTGGTVIQTSFRSNEYSLGNRNQVFNPFKVIINFEHEDDDLKKFGKDELQTLENILFAFKGCLFEKDKRAKIVIRGFASETKFDEINNEIDLANRRANNTKAEIEKILSEDSFLTYAKQIEVVVEEWESSPEDYLRMIKARAFIEVKSDNNLKQDNENYTAEYLNRRVEIVIEKAGNCYP